MNYQDLIDMLASDNCLIRNRAAIALMDANEDRAIPALISTIQKPENENKRGTLVYALGGFDCTEYLDLLIELITTGNYEVSSCAFDILRQLEAQQMKKGAIERCLSSIDISKFKFEHSAAAIEALQELLQ